MKKILFFIYLFVLVIVSAADEDIVISGNVEKIDGSFITVNVNNKKEILKLAPKWYLMENGYFVKEGENVQIKYRKVNNVNSVTEVVRNRKVYRLTDGKGEFLWKRNGIGGRDTGTSSKTWNSSSSNTTTVENNSHISTGNTGTVIGGVGTGGIVGPSIGGGDIGHGTMIKPMDGSTQTGGKINDFGREHGGMGGKRESEGFKGREK